jgi:hypothetical protein
MYHSSGTGKTSPIFVPDDLNLLGYFNENQNTVNNSSSMKMDLSGFKAQLEIAFTF